MNKVFLSRRFFLSLFISWQILFLIIPIFIPFYKAFINTDILNNFIWILKSNYISIFFRSFFFSFITANICLFIGYIISYIISKQNFFLKNLILFFIAIPFLTNFIVHIIAWNNILQKNGPICIFLKSLKIFGSDFNLLHSNFSTLLGYVYCFMPFMIFPLCNALFRFDNKLLEASYDLGASFTKTLFKIIIPITKQGIYTGFFLVLISATGEFTIPEILGGDKYMHCGNSFLTVLLNSTLIEKGSLMAIIFIILLGLFSLFSYFYLNFIIKFLERI